MLKREIKSIKKTKQKSRDVAAVPVEGLFHGGFKNKHKKEAGKSRTRAQVGGRPAQRSLRPSRRLLVATHGSGEDESRLAIVK